MAKRLIALDGKDIKEKETEWSNLIANKKVLLEPMTCLHILKQHSSSFKLTNLEKDVDRLCSVFSTKGIIDPSISKQLMNDLQKDYDCLNLRGLYDTCIGCIHDTLRSCQKSNIEIIPILDAPQPSLLMELLNKDSITGLERKKRVSLVVSLASIAYLYNCFKLPPEFDSSFNTQIESIKGFKDGRTNIADFRHSIEHSNVNLISNRLYFTNKKDDDNEITISIAIDDFINKTEELLAKTNFSMNKRSTEQSTCDHIIKSLKTSIKNGIILDNYALAMIIMQIISSTYESHSKAMMGIIDLNRVIGLSEKTNGQGLVVKNTTIKETRNSPAHGDFTIRDNTLQLFCKQQIVSIDLNNWEEDIKQYRIACMMPQIIFMCISLWHLSNH